MTSRALPQLRDDLELIPGPRSRTGAPTWTIYDPVRNRFFRIDYIAFTILSHWELGNVAEMTQAVERTIHMRPCEEDFDELLSFLKINMLIKRETASSVKEIQTIRKASKLSWGKWAVHNYLFFRIPLVSPQRFLMATKAVGSAFISKKAFGIFCLLLIAGGYLLVEQWDTFLATFLHFTTPQGLLWYVIALIGAKIIHELGHAYTAVHFGCRVPTMGVAFLVMWPVLYTDTSDAWRLADKKQRLAIGGAGMIAELGLAVLATVLWNFLPDGPMRSAAFVTATLTWVMTLGVNLNPFMRFDGYYLFSDYLEVENLQNRTFAYAKWWLRERLFSFGELPPEPFGRRLGQGLIIYAFATWIYRLFLFLGIAVLVYAFFFKLLGLMLFAIEILWFIVMPIQKELMEWKKRRQSLQWNKNIIMTGTGALFAAFIFVFPWRSTVNIPAVRVFQNHTFVFAPLPAQVMSISIKRGQLVKKGDEVMRLSSPELDHQIRQTQRKITLLNLQIRREAAGREVAANIQVLRRKLEKEQSVLIGLTDQKIQLLVRARIDGKVRDMVEFLRPGLWVDDKTPLVQIVNMGVSHIVGYVEDDEIRMIKPGTHGIFYAENPSLPSERVRVCDVANVNTSVLDLSYLASVHGGEIAVEPDSNRRLIPLKGIYRVTAELLNGSPSSDMVLRGTVQLEAQPESLLMRGLRRVWAVIIRESGF